MSRVLEARAENFDERNPLLTAALGLISLGRRLDALLAAHPGDDVELDPRDGHPWDDAVLGLVALRARLHAHLDRCAPAPAPPQAHEDRTSQEPAPQPRPREVLR